MSNTDWDSEREAFLRAGMSCWAMQEPDPGYTDRDGLPITTGCWAPGCEPDSGKSARMCAGSPQTPPDGPDIRPDVDRIRPTSDDFDRYWKGWEFSSELAESGLRNRVLFKFADELDRLRREHPDISITAELAGGAMTITATLLTVRRGDGIKET